MLSPQSRGDGRKVLRGSVWESELEGVGIYISTSYSRIYSVLNIW